MNAHTDERLILYIERKQERIDKWNDISNKIKGAVILDCVIYDSDYCIHVVQKLQKDEEVFYVMIKSNLSYMDESDERINKIREISEELYNEYKK